MRPLNLRRDVHSCDVEGVYYKEKEKKVSDLFSVFSEKKENKDAKFHVRK